MASPLENVRDAIQGFKDYLARIEGAVDMKDWQHNLRRIELFALTQHLVATFSEWSDAQAEESYQEYLRDHADPDQRGLGHQLGDEAKNIQDACKRIARTLRGEA